jgi:hypothetical protein
MHPDQIDGLKKPTEGERTVFRFLKETARPDSDFIGGDEPAIGEQGREPDFVLFGNQQGLLILEVKDWLIHTGNHQPLFSPGWAFKKQEAVSG